MIKSHFSCQLRVQEQCVRFYLFKITEVAAISSCTVSSFLPLSAQSLVTPHTFQTLQHFSH